MTKVLNVETFDETVKSGVVVVDFWAAWCGPCKMLAPTVEELAEDYAGKAVVGKVDVDECPKLAERFNVYSIPTLIIFKDGEPVDRIVGFRVKSEIAKVIDSYL